MTIITTLSTPITNNILIEKSNITIKITTMKATLIIERQNTTITTIQ